MLPSRSDILKVLVVAIVTISLSRGLTYIPLSVSFFASTSVADINQFDIYSSSSTTPPNTIAPMREFPTGRASVHVFAGRLYHNLRSCAAMLIVASSHKFKTINFFILIRYYSALFAKLHHFPHIRI